MCRATIGYATRATALSPSVNALVAHRPTFSHVIDLGLRARRHATRKAPNLSQIAETRRVCRTLAGQKYPTDDTYNQPRHQRISQ